MFNSNILYMKGDWLYLGLISWLRGGQMNLSSSWEPPGHHQVLLWMPHPSHHSVWALLGSALLCGESELLWGPGKAVCGRSPRLHVTPHHSRLEAAQLGPGSPNFGFHQNSPFSLILQSSQKVRLSFWHCLGNTQHPAPSMWPPSSLLMLAL